jgi:hypothetical protein
VVEPTNCPYDASPIEPEADWLGPTRLCCSVCGAAWEWHNMGLRRVREPDRDAILRARSRREPVHAVAAGPIASTGAGIEVRRSPSAPIAGAEVCSRCEREKAGGESCREIQLHAGGAAFAMIRYGEEVWFAKRPPVGRCHGCGVAPGGFHHGGCDMARCPRCAEQLISCNCRFDEADVAR